MDLALLRVLRNPWIITRSGLLVRFLSPLLSCLVVLGSVGAIYAAPISPGPGDGDPLQYPEAMPPIDVAVQAEGLDAQGHWTQTVRLTIKSGGTLGDASGIVFGDVNHVDQIFAAAKKRNAQLYSVAAVPVGQVIDLAIDPSTTYPLQVALSTASTRVLRFTNGVVDTTYLKGQGSVQRVLAFPAGKPTEQFVYPGATGPLKVRSGGKIVDLVYASGQSYGDVVRQAYGLANYATAADLTRQTGWDPTHWPPPTGEGKRIIVNAPNSYAIAPADAGYVPNPDPIGQQRLVALRQARALVGITTARLESFGQIFHVAVGDTTVTASKVAELLYGSAAHRLDVARAAGFELPNVSPAAAAAFDPRLFGRSFDVSIDYVDEHFVVWRRDQSDGQSEVELANGTHVTTYPIKPSGPLILVTYPNGYRRVIYRPDKTLVAVAQGLALFHVAGDLTLPAGTAETMTRDYVAHVIWQWGTGLPRRSTDVPDSVTLVDDPAGAYVVAMVPPPAPRTVVDRATDALHLSNPVLAIVALVVAGSMFALALELTRRSFRAAQRRRW